MNVIILSCFQALRLFCLANELETRAAGLRLEALQHLTVAMAGVDCRELFTLLTAFFGQGTEFQEDPFNYPDGAPEIRPPLDLTDTGEEDEASTAKEDVEVLSTSSAPAPALKPVVTTEVEVPVSAPPKPAIPSSTRDPPVKSCPKITYPDKVADIAQAQGFFPEDKDSLHNTGIPAVYAVRCSGSSGKGRSLYLCPYGDRCSIPPYSGDIASAGSHVCRHHLGHCIQCPYDGNRFYNAAGWREHMSMKHANAPWYRNQLGVDSSLPDSLFTPEPSQSSDPPSTQLEGASVSSSAPAVPDDDVKETLVHVDDVADDDEPPAETDTGIGPYTHEDLKTMFKFLPSDLRKYEYYGGGHWMGRRIRTDYAPLPRLFAAAATAGLKEPEKIEPEEGEEPLCPKKRKHQMHSYKLSHAGKIWRPQDDPDNGASMA